MKLIQSKRFEELGGLHQPPIRRIISNFVFELPSFVLMAESFQKKGEVKSLSSTLHRLKGAAVTCGFTGVAEVAVNWKEAENPLDEKWLAQLRHVVDESTQEWQVLYA